MLNIANVEYLWSLFDFPSPLSNWIKAFEIEENQNTRKKISILLN